MCWYFFHALFFTFFTPEYRCLPFSSIFPLQNCIQACFSLKYILKITIFCFVEKPLFLCVFIPNGFPYIFFHRKVSMKVPCYIIYFHHTILIFWLFFLFHCIIFVVYINTDTLLGENGKCSLPVVWFVADEIEMSTNL